MSATFFRAFSTVERYWALAWSSAASAAFCRCSRAPPSKIGWATPADRVQKSLPPLTRVPSVGLAPPARADSEMLGRRAATATPTPALAACRLASAARMSGRWRTRAAGRVRGRSRGREMRSRSISGAGAAPTSRPSRTDIAVFCCSSALASGGTACSAWAREVSAAATSAWPRAPRSAWRRVKAATSRRAPAWAWAASYWRRSDASCTAPATTLAIKAWRAASYWKRWSSAWAAACSTARRVPPNTSST